jgi:hypothetical protein
MDFWSKPLETRTARYKCCFADIHGWRNLAERCRPRAFSRLEEMTCARTVRTSTWPVIEALTNCAEGRAIARACPGSKRVERPYALATSSALFVWRSLPSSPVQAAATPDPAFNQQMFSAAIRLRAVVGMGPCAVLCRSQCNRCADSVSSSSEDSTQELDRSINGSTRKPRPNVAHSPYSARSPRTAS